MVISVKYDFTGTCSIKYLLKTNRVFFLLFASYHASSHTNKGMSREGTIRSPSAMSAASHAGTSVQVRLRNPGMQRKPRPTSIAVSGMSQSMYDKRTASSAASTPSSYRGPPRCETTYFT